MYTITILQNGDHQIIDRGFKFIVPSSTVIEAEAKRAEGKISAFHLPGSTYKDYYFEVERLPLFDGEFTYRASFWPAMFGYDGRRDWYVKYYSDPKYLNEFLVERLKETLGTTNDEHIKEILGPYHDVSQNFKIS